MDSSLVAPHFLFSKKKKKCNIAKKASIYVGFGIFSENCSHFFFLVYQKINVLMCSIAKNFMLNLLIIECTSRKLSEKRFLYYLCGHNACTGVKNNSPCKFWSISEQLQCKSGGKFDVICGGK